MAVVAVKKSLCKRKLKFFGGSVFCCPKHGLQSSVLSEVWPGADSGVSIVPPRCAIAPAVFFPAKISAS